MNQTTFFANSFEEVLDQFDLSSTSCPLCDKEVPFKTDLKKHLNFAHFRYAIFQKVDGKQGILLPCRRSCFPRSSLKEIKRSHYHCPFCQRCYGRGNSFKVHLKSQEGRCSSSMSKKFTTSDNSNQELEVWIGTDDQNEDEYIEDGNVSSNSAYQEHSVNFPYPYTATKPKDEPNSQPSRYGVKPGSMMMGKRKRYSDGGIEPQNNLSIGSDKYESQNEKLQNADDLFFASILSEVKTLPKKMKSDLKLKILSLVNDSVQSLDEKMLHWDV